jgi:hypothetical protein
VPFVFLAGAMCGTTDVTCLTDGARGAGGAAVCACCTAAAEAVSA